MNDVLLFFNNGGGTKLFAAIGVTYPAGSVVTCTNGTKTLTAKNTSGQWVFAIPEAGTWTVKATSGSNTKSQSVSITSEGQFEQIALSFELVLFDSSLADGYSLSSNYISPAIDLSQYSELEVTTGNSYLPFIVGLSPTPANVNLDTPPAAELAIPTNTTQAVHALDVSGLTGNMHLGFWNATTYSKLTVSVTNSVIDIRASSYWCKIHKIVLR